MDEEQMKHLIALSDRAVNTHVLREQGSANVVIFKAEFDALEAAIEELQHLEERIAAIESSLAPDF